MHMTKYENVTFFPTIKLYAAVPFYDYAQPQSAFLFTILFPC